MFPLVADAKHISHTLPTYTSSDGCSQIENCEYAEY